MKIMSASYPQLRPHCREVTDQFVYDASEKESYKKKVGDVSSYNKTIDRSINGQTSTHPVIT